MMVVFSAIETGSESLECIQTAFFSVSVADFYMHGVVRRLVSSGFLWLLVNSSPLVNLEERMSGRELGSGSGIDR